MARSKRVGWIDWVRALGACSIVFLHVLVSTSLATQIEGARAVAYSVLGIVACRWAVPGFFMISGWLLLDPRKEFGWKKVRDYVVRMLVVLATLGTTFALMQEALPQVQAGEIHLGKLIFAAIADVLCAATWDHLWYVYALLGVYPFVPALRLVQERGGERALRVVAGALVVVGLGVPTAHAFLEEADVVASLPLLQTQLGMYVGNFLAGLACFCVGGCLRYTRHERVWACAGVVSLLVMVCTSVMGIASGRGDQGYVFLQSSCFACAYAASVLLLTRRVVGDVPLREDGIVALLARDSFGIYLVHPFFIHAALLWVDPQGLPPVAFELGLFALSLFSSVLCTGLLRRMPVVRDVI